MHESTISRVTTNKYVHTPQGIFELKFFFNSRHLAAPTATTSSRREAVKIEDQGADRRPRIRKPPALAIRRSSSCCATDGIDIARRTVAKYREQLGILSSSKRKQLF